jgi:NAD(P)-dependent dehydrogenase (short-subunit alcohol dehydrogenase family)
MIAEGLLRAGAAEVIISSRKADACAAAVEALSAFGRCRAIPADLSTPEGVAALAGGLADLDALHLLVNNAGATWGAPIDDFPDAGWDRVMRTNVDGVFRLTVALLPQLRAAAQVGAPARVINIGSVDGLRPAAMENYPYTASKAAVHMLTRHLAKRLASEQITVNAIAPGLMDTRWGRLWGDEAFERVGQQQPLKHIPTLVDISAAAIFLVKNDSMTGQSIVVDGGGYMH